MVPMEDEQSAKRLLTPSVDSLERCVLPARTQDTSDLFESFYDILHKRSQIAAVHAAQIISDLRSEDGECWRYLTNSKREVCEVFLKEFADPTRLFKDLSLLFSTMQDIEYDKFIAINILLSLKHHDLDTDSAMSIFESVKVHLESPIRKYYERGSLLTAAVTGNTVDEDLGEYACFEKYLPAKCTAAKAQSGASHRLPTSECVFRDEFEVKNTIPIKTRVYRYIQQALDDLESEENPDVKANAFACLPSLIGKASPWMIKIVFERTFDVLMNNDACGPMAVDGLMALYLKHTLTFYAAIDFFCSHEATIPTQLLIIEFATQLVDTVDVDIIETLLTYFVTRINSTHLSHNFVVHNIKVLFQHARCRTRTNHAGTPRLEL